MQRKTLITLSLAGALLGVCGLSALVVYSTMGALRASNVRLRWFEDAATSARVTETLRLDVGPDVTLAIEACGGDIDVRAGRDGVVEGEQVVTAWGADAAAALAAAKAVVVRVERDPSAVRITCDIPDEVVLVGGGAGATAPASRCGSRRTPGSTCTPTAGPSAPMGRPAPPCYARSSATSTRRACAAPSRPRAAPAPSPPRTSTPARATSRS